MRTLDPQSLSPHIDRLYRAAWGLCGARGDAPDLVQETLARVLSRPRVLHGDDELYYLMRVLRNTFLTSRRTASRRPVTVATLEEVVAAAPRAGSERGLENGTGAASRSRWPGLCPRRTEPAVAGGGPLRPAGRKRC